MISEKILYQLLKAINENRKIEGISSLSKFSGVAEITIKTNIKDIENHDNIKHSRIGSRNTHVFEYQDKSDSKSNEYDVSISNYNKIVNMCNIFINQHLKKMKKLKLTEDQIVSSSELAGEIFVDIDKVCEKLTSLKCKTRKTNSRYNTLETKTEHLQKLKTKLHAHVYNADPLLESRLMIYLGSARVNKMRLRSSN